MEERIAASLDDPQHDPHGDPIPSRELHLPESAEVSRRQLRPMQKTQVKRVRDNDPELLRYLSEMGVKPEAGLQILGYLPFDNNLRVHPDGTLNW